MATLVTVLFIILIITYKLNECVDTRSLTYGDIFTFYFNAFIGIFLTIFISMIIKTNKPLIYFGKNLIIILCTHYYFTYYLFPYLFEVFGLSKYRYSLIVEMLLTALTMAIMVPIIFLMNKCFYFIFDKTFGKTKRKIEHTEYMLVLYLGL